MKKILYGLMFGATLLLSACFTQNDNTSKIDISIPTPTATSNISSTETKQGYICKNDMLAYMSDVEQQTHIKISDNQREILLDYIANNKVNKLDSATLKVHREEFNKNRKRIISEWEKNTEQKWPVYGENVLSDKGKILRKTGNNYDMHHLVELSDGGRNEWWNMHPAMFPSQHQAGIHRKDGWADKLFGENRDD